MRPRLYIVLLACRHSRHTRRCAFRGGGDFDVGAFSYLSCVFFFWAHFSDGLPQSSLTSSMFILCSISMMGRMNLLHQRPLHGTSRCITCNRAMFGFVFRFCFRPLVWPISGGRRLGTTPTHLQVALRQSVRLCGERAFGMARQWEWAFYRGRIVRLAGLAASAVRHRFSDGHTTPATPYVERPHPVALILVLGASRRPPAGHPPRFMFYAVGARNRLCLADAQFVFGPRWRAAWVGWVLPA